MKAIKLTPKQRELFEKLKSVDGGRLRQHIRPSNAVCYRLLDNEFRPLANYRYGIVQELLQKDVLEINGHDYVLKATSGESEEMDISNLGLVKTER
jgi:hypothetical protein